MTVDVKKKRDAEMTSSNEVVTIEFCTSSSSADDAADSDVEGAVDRVLLLAPKREKKTCLHLQFCHHLIIQSSVTAVQFCLLPP